MTNNTRDQTIRNSLFDTFSGPDPLRVETITTIYNALPFPQDLSAFVAITSESFLPSIEDYNTSRQAKEYALGLFEAIKTDQILEEVAITDQFDHLLYTGMIDFDLQITCINCEETIYDYCHCLYWRYIKNYCNSSRQTFIEISSTEQERREIYRFLNWQRFL
eukprot:397265_1